MSDYYIRFIPDTPDKMPTSQNILLARSYLERFVSSELANSTVKVKILDNAAFIDCGSNLEGITCPVCQKQIDGAWWSEAMDQAAGNCFLNINTISPCCSRSISLNDYIYHMPCGFARFVLEISNPSTLITQEDEKHLESLLGVAIRTVHAHY